MRYLLISLGLLAGWAVFSLAGQAMAADKDADALAEELNEAIVDANNKIHVVGAEFWKTLAPAFKEKEVDLDDLNLNYKQIQKVMAIVQAKLQAKSKEKKIPDSKIARDYYKAHQAFLKVQEGLLKKEYADIIKTMEDETLTAAQKKKKIEAISKKMAKAEEKVFTELKKAQKAFGMKYGIEIE